MKHFFCHKEGQQDIEVNLNFNLLSFLKHNTKICVAVAIKKIIIIKIMIIIIIII